MEERNALVHAQSSKWLTTLYAAFQDEVHLYLVMEYASGGSLRTLLNTREDTMDEQECRFYVAEILCALEELHQLNFIHRDVKPDNCLIDATGHIKLADFGSCMRVDDTNRVTSSETVGTPDYISPEILRAQEGNVSYGQECDWWSLGIILYELLFGEVPFYAESLTQSYGKIMDHEKYFAFPDDFDVSDQVLDLMKKMICRHDIRLGKKGAHEIKSHAWFASIQWGTLRSSSPPFVPQLSGPDDTRYFEDEQDESRKADLKQLKRQGNYSGNHLPFIGYTYLQNTLPVIQYSPSNQQVEELKKELASVAEKLSREQKQHEVTQSQLDQMHIYQDTSLQSQVHHLESLLESETAAHQTLQISLQKNVQDIKAELQVEKSKIASMVERMDHVEKEKTALELQLEEWKRREKEYDQSLQESTKKYQQLLTQLDTEGQARSDIEKKHDTLKHTVQQHKEQLEKAQQELNTKSQQVADLERENAVFRVELDTIGKKMLELQSSLDSAKSAPNPSQDQLEQELEKSLAKIQSLNQEVSALTKQKTLVDMELAQMSKKYSNQLELVSQLSHKLELSDKRLQEQDIQMKSLVESNDKMTKRSGAMQTDLAQLVQQLRDTRSQLSVTSLKLSSLEKNQTQLVDQVAEWKIKYQAEVAKHEEYGKKEKEWDKIVNEERKSLRLAENSVKSLESEKKELKATTARLQERLLTLKSEHTKIQQSADTKLAQVEQSHKEAYDALSLEHQQIVHSLNELKSKWEEESERFAHTEHMNEQYRIQIDELTMQIKEDMALQAKLNQRIHELEQSREDLKEETFLSPTTVSSFKTTSKSMQNLKADTKLASLAPPSQPLTPTKSNASLLGSSRALKIRSVLFGNKKEDRDRALQKLQDAEELLKQDHMRKSSSSTVQSQKSKFSENPSLHVDYHPSEPLKGYIKMPKGGKIKKGWKKVFAVVKDNKLVTFEKEKDAEDPTMKPLDVIDLRADVFHVKTVTQAELIHANAKDIDCIFKLHFAMNATPDHTATLQQDEPAQDFDSLFNAVTVDEKTSSKRTSLRPESSTKRHTLGSSPHQKRMTQLQSMITMEEKYALGASSILAAATTENQRTLAQQQLEVFHKNIKDWKAELEQLILDQQAALPGVEDQLKTQPSLEGLENLVLHQDVQDWKKELEEGLKRKYQEKEAVMKLYQSQFSKPSAPSPKSTMRQSSNSNVSRDTEAALHTIERDIQKLKEDLATLNSNNQNKISHLLKSLNNHLSVNSHKGHYFKKRVTNKPMECSRCREALWLPSDGAKTIIECQICHAVCHTFCKAGFDISCRDFVALKDATPLYFMALDAQDRNKWISGILYYIRENERKSTYSYPGSPIHTDPSYPIPPLQPSPSHQSLDDDAPLSPFINMYITGSNPDLTTHVSLEDKKTKRLSLGDKAVDPAIVRDYRTEPPPPLPPLLNIKSNRESHTKP